MWQRFHNWILKRSLDDRGNMGLFVAGAVVFFAGGGLIYVANLRMEPSLAQELVALIGVLIGIGGAITAAMGYIALSVFRLIRHTRKHDQ